MTVSVCNRVPFQRSCWSLWWRSWPSTMTQSLPFFALSQRPRCQPLTILQYDVKKSLGPRRSSDVEISASPSLNASPITSPIHLCFLPWFSSLLRRYRENREGEIHLEVCLDDVVYLCGLPSLFLYSCTYEVHSEYIVGPQGMPCPSTGKGPGSGGHKEGDWSRIISS